MNNIQFKNIVGSPTFMYKRIKSEKKSNATLFSEKKDIFLNNENEKSPVKKKQRITEKYFKNWIKSMNDIYDTIYSDVNQNLNIYENRDISIQDMFHLFLIQMNFESKRILNIDFNLSITFGTSVTNLDFISRKKYMSNKKLVKEVIPIITDDYTNTNNLFIESANCELYIDKRNKNIYKVYDIFSLLDMIQESFIQKILYSYLPNNIAKVHGIYKTNEKNVNYIMCQTYFEDGTLHNKYNSLDKKQILNILISLCNQLIHLQKELNFLHNDLKVNNICINIQNEEAYFIDFGYSSLVCNNQLIHGYFELELDEFNQNKSLESYTKNKAMTHQTVINDRYRNSSDLFYLIFTILYYNHSQFKNPLYDILYDMFTVKDSIKGNINIFDIIYTLEHNSFQHAGFFMTKNNELFTQYFGNNIENIDTFYEQFLPENLSTYLSTFIENN